MKKFFLLSIIAILFIATSFAQSVGINTNGTVPNASAMLDVKNPNKGLLIPRVVLTGTNDATTIPNPVTSLLVYNLSNSIGATAVSPGFYYWSGTEWVKLVSVSNSAVSTSWVLTGNTGTTDGTNFIGTTDNIPFNIRVNNQKAGRIDAILANTFWGYRAGNATTGTANTANGYQALFSNTTGDDNTVTGSFALNTNSSGNSNTATGFAALYFNATGNNNTALGYSALGQNTTGSNNTALGYSADVSSGALTNATALGSGAVVNASNKVRIGNGNVTVIEGQVGFSTPSDKRFKYNIQDNVPGLDFIKQLQPVTYYFDEEKLAEFTKTGIINNSNVHASISNSKNQKFKIQNSKSNIQLHTGFLAQDVEKIAKDLGYNFDGIHAPANDKDHYSLAYSQFIMPLVKGMQEQQQIIEDLKAQVAALTKAVNTLTHK